MKIVKTAMALAVIPMIAFATISCSGKVAAKQAEVPVGAYSLNSFDTVSIDNVYVIRLAGQKRILGNDPDAPEYGPMEILLTICFVLPPSARPIGSGSRGHQDNLSQYSDVVHWDFGNEKRKVIQYSYHAITDVLTIDGVEVKGAMRKLVIVEFNEDMTNSEKKVFQDQEAIVRNLKLPERAIAELLRRQESIDRSK